MNMKTINPRRNKYRSKPKNLMLTSIVLLGVFSLSVHAQPLAKQDKNNPSIDALQQRVNQLEQLIELRLLELDEQIIGATPTKSNIHFGGYGELHYNHLEQAGKDFRQLDLHRWVLFVGYNFNDRARLVTELEVEHVLVSGGGRGAVELEQAYIEFNIKKSMQLQVGVILTPLSIINETHEPPTFYGVERPVIETTIIPTTWYVTGAKFSQQFDNGVTYDLMVSEGLKTQDPNVNPSAEPFNLKLGKQKGSFADAFNLAMTVRVSYRGAAGLEISGYAQYQPDIDQSAQNSYADAAVLVGGHAIIQRGAFTSKILYADWTLDGSAAETAEKHHQYGGYVELSWKPNRQWSAFFRQNQWSQTAGVNASQSDFGVNYYPYENIVFKADYQLQNADAGDADGFNLGMGYLF
ncbi:MAG: hypothetical protein JKX83_09505 [Pseudomonadales bacterium]|nr:hypothetical protein [Pseudomonadales bacterium]